MDYKPFTLDSDIQDFIEGNSPKEKYKLYYNVIRNIDLLNSLPDVFIEYDLNNLETTIMDVMEEEITNDDKMMKIHEVIKEAGINYIESFGIKLIEDRNSIYYYQVSNLLFGLYNMFNTNTTGAEFILETLRNENNEDDVNLSELLEEYTSVSVTEYFELIQSVDPSLVEAMMYYFKFILDNYNPALDEETNNGIKSLLEIDGEFNNTDVVKDMLKLGLKPNLFANSLNNLYFHINRYESNPEFIPFEIAATLFLCDDSEQDMDTFFREEVNLDLVEFLEKEPVIKNTIITSTKELIQKLQPKVVRR